MTTVMENKISIVIADDHEVFRDGLKLMLNKQKDFALVGEAKDGKSLVAEVLKHQPQVVITDIDMPILNGIEATQEILSVLPNANIIGLSMHDDSDLILKTLEAGAKGYLIKNASKQEICLSIRTVALGNTYYCNNTGNKLANQLVNSTKFNPYKTQSKINFNDREKQVMELLCKGMTTKETAAAIFLSERTIEGLKNKIQSKIGASNAVGIAVYAIKNKIIDIDEINLK